jgi:hypothetical protein
MGNIFSEVDVIQSHNQNDNTELQKRKSLITDDDNINISDNIKKSSNYNEIECIDDYNNYYINSQKKRG